MTDVCAGGTDNLLSRVRDVIEERDVYRATCERQGRVLRQLVELMGKLQEFIDEEPHGEAAATAAPETERALAPAPPPSARRYTDDEARDWARALRGGASQVQVSTYWNVSTHTIHKRLASLGFDPASGRPLAGTEAEPEPAPIPEPEPAPEPEPEPEAEPAIAAVEVYDDDAVAEWVRMMDAGRTAEQIADEKGLDPFLVRGLVRGWREEHEEHEEGADAPDHAW